MTIASCEEEFLETFPTDEVSPAVALSNQENIQTVLNGVHRSLYSQLQTIFPGGSSARAGEHYWVPIGDNLTGRLIHSANSNNLGWRDEMQWTNHTLQNSTTVLQLWYHRYNTILHANMILAKINEGSLPVTPKLKEMEGQALTYRAYAHLSLVQHFGRGYLIGNPTSDLGVPINLVPQATGPRATVQQVYDQVEADLDAAIAAFGSASPRPTGNAKSKSQLNINVAYGIKARMALNKGDWQTAATNAVLARNGFPLMSEAAWKSGFNTTTLSEVIWGSNVIAAETTFFRSYFYLASNTFNGSQIRNNPKIADRRMVDAIPATDYRGDVFLVDAPNTNSSAANGLGGFANNTNPLYPTEAAFNAAVASIKSTYGLASGHNLHPYYQLKLKQVNPGSIDPDDIILMRSSEMYLIEAEAKVMMGDVPGAQAALLPLASARDSAYDVTVYNTQATLFEHIKFQRRLELHAEGFGYTDHIRWDEGIDHAANGGSGASAVLYQNAYQVARPSTNDDWIFKIPQAELDANPDIGPDQQN